MFTGAPIASTTYAPFTGTFTGLGNTISNLNIQDVTPIGQSTPSGDATNGAIGLFGFVGSGGVVRDVNLSNATITGGDGIRAGALVGRSRRDGDERLVVGQVTVGDDTYDQHRRDLRRFRLRPRGRSGRRFSDGQIINAHSSASVIAGGRDAGGLVGQVVNSGSLDRRGSITNSSASGSVTVGDLNVPPPRRPAGWSARCPARNIDITGSSANGPVAGGGDGAVVGGLRRRAGSRDLRQRLLRHRRGQRRRRLVRRRVRRRASTTATITTSYATGAVTQTAGGADGGSATSPAVLSACLTGGSSITQSYSSGAVQTVSGPDSGSYTWPAGSPATSTPAVR